MISRFFAWGIHQVMKVYEPRIAERKRALFQNLHGNVLELGPGTGPNLKYFPKDVSWFGVEPNPHMRKYLEAEAERVGLHVDLREASAMKLPFEDNSMDYVVGTLVLCSVPDPEVVLAEVLRVLKPGGQYHFIEHVAAKPGTWHAVVQRTLKPLWCWCADGCHVDRETAKVVRKAGFETADIEPFQLRFPIIAPHIMGIATRGD
jgi:ubiquinone/menaquinone biosynthesis C-methylase UbiE